MTTIKVLQPALLQPALQWVSRSVIGVAFVCVVISLSACKSENSKNPVNQQNGVKPIVSQPVELLARQRQALHQAKSVEGLLQKQDEAQRRAVDDASR